MSQFQLELWQFKNICMEMAELGVANYIKSIAPGKDMLSQREAYSAFGDKRVQKWVRDGLVTSARQGPGKNSKKAYSKAELMAANEGEKMQSTFLAPIVKKAIEASRVGEVDGRKQRRTARAKK